MKREELKINHEIKSPLLRLIGENIPNSGDVYSIRDAINLADMLCLDLVEVSSNANPPVAKIVDVNKYIYDNNKKKKELEKKQNNKSQKIVEFTVNIAEHDLIVKEKMIENFINTKHEVKIKIKFKGRELSLESVRDKGFIILCNISEKLSNIAKANDVPKIENKDMVLILKPKK